jgi:hypothetical protein
MRQEGRRQGKKYLLLFSPPNLPSSLLLRSRKTAQRTLQSSFPDLPTSLPSESHRRTANCSALDGYISDCRERRRRERSQSETNRRISSAYLSIPP